MQIESHIRNEIFAHRYKGEDAKYALVISHGLGGHGGIYDVFCEHHAPKGVDIWSFDAPGHGRSTTTRPRGQWTMEEWAQASRDWAEHIKETTGLPVFTLGSSLGVSAAVSAIDSDAVTGAILMGSLAVPGSALIEMHPVTAAYRSDAFEAIIEQLGRGARLDISAFFDFDKDYGYVGAADQKKLDPYNTWSYDLASWASLMQYEPPVKVADNTKPIFYTAGGDDDLCPAPMLDAMFECIGGPKELKVYEGVGHQLMLFHTAEYSKDVHAFCLKNI